MPLSTEFVYADTAGGPLRRRNWMRRVWKLAIATVDVPPDLNFHDLRHSHVAVLIKLGEHPKTIANRLGHKSVRMVLDIYGGLFDEVSADVAKKLSALAGVSRRGPKPDSGTVDVSP